MDEHAVKHLCLTAEAFIYEVGVPKGTYDSLKARERFEVIGYGGNGRQVWIKYESLPANYKEMVQAKYGNPYQYQSAQVIREHLILDPEDSRFITNYTYGENNDFLKPEVQERYCLALKYLNLMSRTTVKDVKETMLLDSKTTFNNAVVQLINSETIVRKEMKGGKLVEVRNQLLPTDYQALLKKVKQYEAEGAQVVVHKMYGKPGPKKVTDPQAIAHLSQMIAHHHGFDYTEIERAYNKYAEQNGFKTITSQTIGNFRKEHDYMITAFREGKNVAKDKYQKQVPQERPTAPLLLVNNDDNTVDMWWQDDKGIFNRFTAVIVTDCFQGDYILGWALGYKLTNKLVVAAYHNAIHHIKELTGQYLKPYELKYDRWGLKELQPMYNALGIGFPHTLHRPQGKMIEQSFGRTWHQELKKFKGYSGYNITAKTRTNMDDVTKRGKEFYTLPEAIQAFAQFIDNMRQREITSLGVSRQKHWLNGWEARKDELAPKLALSDRVRLGLFGVQHTHPTTGLPQSNTITTRVLEPTIGKKLRYDMPDVDFDRHVGKQVSVYYDKYDMNTVLAVADGGKIQIVCHRPEYIHGAIYDQQPGERKRLNTLLEARDRKFKEQLAKHAKDKLIVGVSAEAYLLANVNKELAQAAEDTYYEELLLPQSSEASDEGSMGLYGSNANVGQDLT